MDLFITTPVEGMDLVTGPGDLVQDLGLQSAILLSLFCDARDEDVPAGMDPRGWWADADGDQWGSRLWSLSREVASSEVAERARQTAEGALAWLIEDGVAESVEVVAELTTPGRLELDVQITRGRATRWQHLWEQLNTETPWAGGVLRLRTA